MPFAATLATLGVAVSTGVVAAFAHYVLDFDWQLARSLKLTQDANLVADAGGSTSVIVDSDTTSVLLSTGLEAKVSEGLTTRLSYTLDYDSNPPIGAVSTDTLTRFTLVYGF